MRVTVILVVAVGVAKQAFCPLPIGSSLVLSRSSQPNFAHTILQAKAANSVRRMEIDFAEVEIRV